jgi:hypothetical protein
MIELTILTILFTIVVIVIKPGRTPPLENPLVIERTGQFRATLASKLNLAQPLLESISKNLSSQARSLGDTNTFYFSIQDGDVKAHGAHHYLLGVTLHDRILHFAVCSPVPLIYDYNAILNSTAAALSEIELNKETISRQAEAVLEETIQSSAAKFGVKITRLTNPE